MLTRCLSGSRFIKTLRQVKDLLDWEIIILHVVDITNRTIAVNKTSITHTDK
jgi:hypothetical protein